MTGASVRNRKLGQADWDTGALVSAVLSVHSSSLHGPLGGVVQAPCLATAVSRREAHPSVAASWRVRNLEQTVELLPDTPVQNGDLPSPLPGAVSGVLSLPPGLHCLKEAALLKALPPLGLNPGASHSQ